MSSKLKGRYCISSEEAEFQPGSHKRILKNLLGIKSKREMDIAESEAYNQVTIKAMENFDDDHRFTVDDIAKLHKLWLGKVYSWAGEFRNVNVSKDGFQFASAHLVPRLMYEFEGEVLSKYTPCGFSNLNEIAEAIAVVHVEFILIHPFREGNGRLGRLIAVLMGLQANLPILNFETIKGKKKIAYIQAVQDGLNRNYQPMTKIFEDVIKRTVKLYQKG